MSRDEGNFMDKKNRVPMLTSTNYPAWERAMSICHKAERCLSVIDNQLYTPDPVLNIEPGANAPLQRAHDARFAK
jgi:hypothetical protein